MGPAERLVPDRLAPPDDDRTRQLRADRPVGLSVPVRAPRRVDHDLRPRVPGVPVRRRRRVPGPAGVRRDHPADPHIRGQVARAVRGPAQPAPHDHRQDARLAAARPADLRPGDDADRPGVLGALQRRRRPVLVRRRRLGGPHVRLQRRRDLGRRARRRQHRRQEPGGERVLERRQPLAPPIRHERPAGGVRGRHRRQAGLDGPARGHARVRRADHHRTAAPDAGVVPLLRHGEHPPSRSRADRRDRWREPPVAAAGRVPFAVLQQRLPGRLARGLPPGDSAGPGTQHPPQPRRRHGDAEFHDRRRRPRSRADRRHRQDAPRHVRPDVVLRHPRGQDPRRHQPRRHHPGGHGGRHRRQGAETEQRPGLPEQRQHQAPDGTPDHPRLDSDGPGRPGQDLRTARRQGQHAHDPREDLHADRRSLQDDHRHRRAARQLQPEPVRRQRAFSSRSISPRSTSRPRPAPRRTSTSTSTRSPSRARSRSSTSWSPCSRRSAARASTSSRPGSPPATASRSPASASACSRSRTSRSAAR